MNSACITGGSGFLGATIVRQLLSSGIRRIVVFDTVAPPDDIASSVTFIQGDVRDRSALEGALTGVEVVFHAAAVVDWGTSSPEEVRSVNVDGTRAVVAACRAAATRVLIFTSSLDATFAGRNLIDVDEDLPYPSRHPNMYCRSKMEGELIVNAAHSRDMATCSIRPADIYGEADPYHMPALIDMAMGGFYVRIGNGRAVGSHAYVGNVAAAHIQAARAFLAGNRAHGGKSYFIADGHPANFFAFFDRILVGAGYELKPPGLRLPFAVFYVLGLIVELATLPFRRIMKTAPRISRFAAVYTCTTYTFRPTRAIRDFGYQERYSEDQAVDRTIAYYRERRMEAPAGEPELG